METHHLDPDLHCGDSQGTSADPQELSIEINHLLLVGVVAIMWILMNYPRHLEVLGVHEEQPLQQQDTKLQLNEGNIRGEELKPSLLNMKCKKMENFPSQRELREKWGEEKWVQIFSH